MKVRLFLVVALCAFALAPVFGQDRNAPVMGRILVQTAADERLALDLGLDLMEYREGKELVFLTTRAELDDLAAKGWHVRVDAEATATLTNRDTFGGGYRTVEETYAFLNQMQAQYPNLCHVFSYGQSWDKINHPGTGYDLMAVRLTSPLHSEGFKPTFYVQGGIHAREYVPPENATRYIQYLLSNYGIDADATWLLDEQQVVVVPILNPDGRKIAETGQLKRKNNNNTTGGCTQPNTGIDLNRNYAFDWGTVNRPSDPPCGETWPGLTPASEPEISAGQALIASIFPDQRPAHDRTTPAPLDATGVTLDMHSTGNLDLYPWGEDTLPPPNLQLRTIAQKMATYNGYSPIQTIQLYATSGTSQDWTYGELGVAGFGMESGLGPGSGGGFMPPDSCMDGDVDNFYKEMAKHEDHFKNIYNGAASANMKLKFVARYENGKASVGLQHIDSKNDLYHLYGKDNVVLFYTDRYTEQPLVVKGAGAGAEVTASGVFADIIRTASV